jgi:hypothetical protein
MANPSDIPIVLQGPSLKYPLGGEYITSNQMTIEWVEPESITSSTALMWYELLFTEYYRIDEKDSWEQIAIIPSGVTSFNWNIPRNIKGTECRMGIRAVAYNGERSRVSSSASSFSIVEKGLPSPVVFEPTDNSSQFVYVTIALDRNGLLGQFSQRAFYEINYKSDSLGIEWTGIASNVPVNTVVVYWDIRELISASDYMLRVELVDENIVSKPTYINNIKINSLNYFLIDTVPPVGYINIENNLEYSNKRDIVLSLKAYDKTTGVEDVRIKQLNVGDATTPISYGEYQDMTAFLSWNILEEDGVKVIQSEYRDYAGNVLEDDGTSTYFRTYKDLSNNNVSCFLSSQGSEVGDDHLWTAFGGSSFKLYEDISWVSDLSYEVTDMVYYSDILYIAAKTTEGYGVLQKYYNDIVMAVYSFDTEDSVINSMVIFDDKIFLGLEDGRLLGYDFVDIVDIYGDNYFIKSISHLEVVADILFVFYNNSETSTAMYKNDNGDYVFNTIDI